MKSQTGRSWCIALACCLGAGCASVPKQLDDAMDKQREEIANVKTAYRQAVDELVSSIEEHHLEILALHETALLARESKSLDGVDGCPPEVDECFQVVKRTGDPDVDHVHLSTQAKLRAYFKERRAQARRRMAALRVQYAAIDANFGNIESINRAVGDYIDSLARLRNARDAVSAVVWKKIAGLESSPVTARDLPDPATLEDLAEAFEKRQ